MWLQQRSARVVLVKSSKRRRRQSLCMYCPSDDDRREGVQAMTVAVKVLRSFLSQLHAVVT